MLARLLRRRSSLWKISLWVLAVTVLTLISAVGYVVLEGWSFYDGIYMAVTTLTTTGFREVHPMDQGGQIWTMAVSMAGIGVIFGTVGIAAEAFMAEWASGERGARRMQDNIDRLRNHYVVCGYGRVGSLVARQLRAEGAEVVVLDSDVDSLASAKDEGFHVVPGDGTSDEVLTMAGVARAQGLVACIDSDANNVYVTLTARALNPGLFIVGRASVPGVIAKLKQAGADRAISPYMMAGRRLAHLVTRPGVMDFIDSALSSADLDYSIEEVVIGSGSPMAGWSVGALRERGVFTLAVGGVGGAIEHNPPDARVLAVGDHLIVSGATDQLQVLDEA